MSGRFPCYFVKRTASRRRICRREKAVSYRKIASPTAPKVAARHQSRNADSADPMADRNVIVNGVILRPPGTEMPSPSIPKAMHEKMLGRLKSASMREPSVDERFKTCLA